MDDIELIKQKINIVDLIQEYLPLKKAGINFRALCPFHQEKTPSLMVSPERGIWRCFGCNLGGDIFKFLMEKEGMDFREALEILAKRAGIVLRRSKIQAPDKRSKLFEVNLKAAQFFHHLLTKHQLGKRALEYLTNRGLSGETIEQFNLGYAPNSWDSLKQFLLKRGFSLEELAEAGLVIPFKNSGYDRFRGRVIFPLYDVKEWIVGFAGRVLDENEPKYINTPQTPLFDKSNFLFGLHLARGEIKNRNQAILTEGEMDMILSFQSGVRNVVATKGTALTVGQIELVKKYTDNMTLCFDQDLAGDSASRRGIEMADQAGLNIKVVQIKDGKDPADICQKDVSLWAKAVEEAVPVYDYYLTSVALRYSPKTAEGKKRVAAELLPIWAKISDPLVREHYLQKLATHLLVDEEILRKQLLRYTSIGPRVYKSVLEKVSSLSITPKSRRELLEEYLLALLLKIPKQLTYVPTFPETLFLSDSKRTIYVMLVLYLDSISFKAQEFNIGDFVKSLPGELIGVIDRLYLIDIDEKLSRAQAWQKEVDAVVGELKKSLIKSSLERLSNQIKSAQEFDKIELLESLNRKFRDLSVKLKNL